MLKEKLLNDLKEAMKNKDEIKKNTIQMVRAGILQVVKDNGINLEDNQIIDIIAKEAKKRKDASVEFEKSGRLDLISQNKREIEILMEYLPEQLSKEEVEKIVKNIIKSIGATSIKEMGAVMKLAKKEIGVRSDGKTINEIVKALLS